MCQSTTLATDACMMPGSPSLVEGGELVLPLSAAHHLRHQVGMATWLLHVQSRVQYPSQFVHHQLGIAHIGTALHYQPK